MERKVGAAERLCLARVIKHQHEKCEVQGWITRREYVPSPGDIQSIPAMVQQ